MTWPRIILTSDDIDLILECREKDRMSWNDIAVIVGIRHPETLIRIAKRHGWFVRGERVTGRNTGPHASVNFT